MLYCSELETLFKKEGEKCESLALLHNMAASYYNALSVCVNLPLISLSAVGGFLSTTQLFEDQMLALGGLSIFLSILKSMETYFGWTKRSEQHRYIALAYQKLHRIIATNLSLDRGDRMRAKELIDLVQNELDTLTSSEPIIPNIVIRKFKKQYGEYDTAKPSIANGLTSIRIYSV